VVLVHHDIDAHLVAQAEFVEVAVQQLAGFDGVEVCRRIRTFSDAYLIMLTARVEEVDKLIGLSVGADDYLTKPFSPRELVARIQVMLRRPRRSASRIKRFGSLAIDLDARTVSLNGSAIDLTRTEFDILALLARNADRVVTSRMMLEQVWGPDYVSDTQTLRVHMSHLRHKIEPAGGVPRYILTEPGVGFRFVGDEEPASS